MSFLARLFERRFWKGYREYLERHDAFYPSRPRLSYRGYKVWAKLWDQTYQPLWNEVQNWMDEHDKTLEFQSAPDFKRIQKLEEMLCV